MKTCDPKDFDERCHELLLKIPIGRVTTYKEIAHALGCRGYRAVGQSLNRNKKFISVPCHRVVKSSGEVGGYALGKNEKIRLLLKKAFMWIEAGFPNGQFQCIDFLINFQHGLCIWQRHP